MIEIVLYTVILILVTLAFFQFRKNTILAKTNEMQQAELQSKDIRLMQYN